MLHDDHREPAQVGTDKALQHPSQEWLKENRKAIDQYNRRVDEHGVFSDDLRTF